jgi:Lsr2
VQLALAFLEVKMATKITIVLEDDIEGGPAEETLRFGLDGREYEIDLSSTNAAAFRQQIAPYIEHARRAGSRQPQRLVRTTASRERSADIRAWARDNGIAVSERGRIPASVIERYEATTGDA